MGNNLKLGGVGKRVQIDESWFHSNKPHLHATSRIKAVVLGMVQEDTKQLLTFSLSASPHIKELVEQNKDPSPSYSCIKPFLLKFIEKGTTIVTDGAMIYQMFMRKHKKDMNFKHEIVNHRHEFVNRSICIEDPSSSTIIHTNTIEGSWGKIKQSLSKGGFSKMNLSLYLAEMTFRRECSTYKYDKFDRLLTISNIIFHQNKFHIHTHIHSYILICIIFIYIQIYFM
jgi:hypothetical protein